MKANMISHAVGVNREKVDEPVVSHNLADNEAIVSVVLKDDGKSLCFTDKNGAKLYVDTGKKGASLRIESPSLQQSTPGFKSTVLAYHAYSAPCGCGCGCRCGFIAGQLVCLTSTGQLCPHH
jgi:hypothetical protein